MSALIHDLLPRKPAQKKGKRENEDSGIECPKCMKCRMEFKKHNYVLCNDDECHYELFHDWITYKYRDNPSMLNVSKERWRFVLHSEYYDLANFCKYTKMRQVGEVSWPFNFYDKGSIPDCIHASLERFINEIYSKQANAWFRNLIETRLLDKKTKARMMSKTEADIVNDYTIMMKGRSRELTNCNNNELPEQAKTTSGMATHKIKPTHD